jgi:O-antigen ligase
MYGAYLGKNYVGRFLMPGFMFILLNELYSEGKALTKKSIVQCSLIIMAILLSLSGTAIVGVIVFWLCFFLFSKFGVNKATTVFKFSLYSMVAFILIYFFHIQEYFEFFIVRILHKDLSFTGRTEIWDVSIRTIQNNLLYGVGLRNTYTAFLLNHAHSHQYWLQILLYGGIIAFALVLLLYLFASRNLYSLKCETGSIIISVIIISYLIMGIDEALNNAYFLLPLIVFAGTYKSCSSIDYYG